MHIVNVSTAVIGPCFLMQEFHEQNINIEYLSDTIYANIW